MNAPPTEPSATTPTTIHVNTRRARGGFHDGLRAATQSTAAAMPTSAAR